MFYQISTLLTNTEHVGQFFGAIWPIFLALGGVLAFFRYIAKKARVWFVQVIDERVVPIQKQFENNGGSSMRDSIDNIDKKIGQNVQLLADHTASDSTNFDHITSTLLSLMEGQANARGTAISVKNDLDKAAVKIKTAVDNSATDVKTELVVAATDVKDHVDISAENVKQAIVERDSRLHPEIP